MSFLFYIKDPIPLVLVGGVSGIGKTSIIDVLLSEYGDFFHQPRSYTSRPPRHQQERYIFVTEEEIKHLFASGHLLNLDEAYGHFYGISKDSVWQIKHAGKIPIKEVHPKNFRKIKSTALQVVTVVVENKHLSHKNTRYAVRPGRERESDEWSKDIPIDIFVNIAGASPREAALYFLRKLYAHHRHTRVYDLPPAEIDELNKKGYSTIADEFDDTKRITTKNFHDASLPFWRAFFENYLDLGGPSADDDGAYPIRILEIGPGNGWLFSQIDPPPDSKIYGVDIADAMSAPYLTELLVSSARNLPFQQGFFDIAVASLGDPFFYPESIVEISRVLKRGGLFAITLPSYTWARAYRKDFYKTTFIKRDGKQAKVYSFCRGLDEIYDIFSIARLAPLAVEELYLPKQYTDSISPAIMKAAFERGLSYWRLPIVVGAIFMRQGESL